MWMLTEISTQVQALLGLLGTRNGLLSSKGSHCLSGEMDSSCFVYSSFHPKNFIGFSLDRARYWAGCWGYQDELDMVLALRMFKSGSGAGKNTRYRLMGASRRDT